MHIDEDDLMRGIGLVGFIILVFSFIMYAAIGAHLRYDMQKTGKFEYKEIIYKVTIDTTATDSLREWRKK